MDAYDIAQEIRMERQFHKGSFLIVEGKTDVARFKKYVSKTECSFVNAHSVVKAKEALNLTKERSIPGVLAIVDADFDRLSRKGLIAKDSLLYSTSHDFDLDWVTLRSLETYLNEVGDETKINAFGGHQEIIKIILECLKPVSVAKFLNRARVFNFKTSGIEASEYYKKGCDIQGAFVSALISNEHLDESKRLSVMADINKARKKSFDLYQLTNGHDFCSVLGVMLKEELGNRKTQQTWGSEVEKHLRLSFDDTDFTGASIYQDIIDWETTNKPYKILDDRIRG